MSPELIFNSLSSAVAIITAPFVRAETDRAKVVSPTPEMLLAGYSVAITHLTCATARPVSAVVRMQATAPVATARRAMREVRLRRRASMDGDPFFIVLGKRDASRDHPSSSGSGTTVMPAASSAARTARITGTAVGSSPWMQKVWISPGIFRPDVETIAFSSRKRRT